MGTSVVVDEEAAASVPDMEAVISAAAAESVRGRDGLGISLTSAAVTAGMEPGSAVAMHPADNRKLTAAVRSRLIFTSPS